ncbi:type II secretion system protein [candidate division WWE3 bacterium]|nr:type II secretion system protein [candidate division WWE3 bacterium]
MIFVAPQSHNSRVFYTLALKQSHGFTLIELLLVVALIAVLSSFLIPGFSGYIDNQNIVQANELLKSDLRSVQNKALTGVDASSGTTNYWGIKIASQNAPFYYTFKSSSNTAGACDSVNLTTATKSDVLMGGATVRDGVNACIFFSMKNGDANFQNNNGSSMFKVGYADKTPCRAVEVNAAGMIRGVELCP